MEPEVKRILRGYLILLVGASIFGVLFVIVFLITYPPFVIPFAWLWLLFFNYLFIISSIISVVFALLGSFLIVIEGVMVEPYRRPKQVIVISTFMVLIGFAFTPIGWQFFTGIFLLTYNVSGSILALALITLAWNFWYIISGLFYGMVQIILGLFLFRKAMRDYYEQLRPIQPQNK